MRTEGELSSLVIQALRYLGKDAVGPEIITRLRIRLSPAENRELLRDARYATDWIFAVARQVAEEDA
jgi:rRNA-processing protein FCF1